MRLERLSMPPYTSQISSSLADLAACENVCAARCIRMTEAAPVGWCHSDWITVAVIADRTTQ